MRCSNCGADNDNRFNFCCTCGRPLGPSVPAAHGWGPVTAAPPRLKREPINPVITACKSVLALIAIILFSMATLYGWLEMEKGIPFPSPILLILQGEDGNDILYVIARVLSRDMSFFADIRMHDMLPLIVNSVLCVGMWLAYASGVQSNGKQLYALGGLQTIKVTLIIWMIIRLAFWGLLVLALCVSKADASSYYNDVYNEPISITLLTLALEGLICKFCVNACSAFLDIGGGISKVGRIYVFTIVLLFTLGICTILFQEISVAHVLEGAALILFGVNLIVYNNNADQMPEER